jgi:glycosyltransferase involved in cell wall biosynthesis
VLACHAHKKYDAFLQPSTSRHSNSLHCRTRNTLKLLVNLESVNSTLTGVGLYVREILRRVVASPEIDDVAYFLGHRKISALQANTILAGRRQTAAKAKWHHKAISTVRSKFPEGLWYVSNLLFWWNTRPFRNHIYLELNNVARPFTGDTFLVCHDLSHLHFPEFHPQDRIRYFELFFEQSIKRAKRVATVSNAIRYELEQQYGLRDCIVASPASSINASADTRQTSELSLPDRYVLSLGSLEPRKNLNRLLDAYLNLDKAVRSEFPLVIAGAGGWENKELKTRLSQLSSAGEIVHLGYVEEADMFNLYKGATLLVYLSTYEGFGMPVIEAMVANTPVLINDEAALIETAGAAAAAVDASDLAAVTAKLSHLLNNDALRIELVELGKQNIARYSWDKSAKRIIDGLKDLNPVET